MCPTRSAYFPCCPHICLVGTSISSSTYFLTHTQRGRLKQQDFKNPRAPPEGNGDKGPETVLRPIGAKVCNTDFSKINRKARLSKVGHHHTWVRRSGHFSMLSTGDVNGTLKNKNLSTNPHHCYIRFHNSHHLSRMSFWKEIKWEERLLFKDMIYSVKFLLYNSLWVPRPTTPMYKNPDTFVS